MCGGLSSTLEGGQAGPRVCAHLEFKDAQVELCNFLRGLRGLTQQLLLEDLDAHGLGLEGEGRVRRARRRGGVALRGSGGCVG